MLTAEQIAQAKREHTYASAESEVHEHDDCIRMAYAWLDAQTKLKNVAPSRYLPTKHLIEHWAGRYVTEADVEVAARLHPEIRGKYPTFNLSKRVVVPSFSRLEGISQAMSQPRYRNRLDEDIRDFYAGSEEKEAA